MSVSRIAIVGNGDDKFTPATRAAAESLIRELLSVPGAILVSGHSPVGGVDIWAEGVADELGFSPERKIIHAPEVNQWEPNPKRLWPDGSFYGFKARDIDIATDGEEVHVIVVAAYPRGYGGRRFEYCYHCRRAGRPGTDHVKSGACWTMNHALGLGGRRCFIHIVHDEATGARIETREVDVRGYLD